MNDKLRRILYPHRAKKCAMDIEAKTANPIEKSDASAYDLAGTRKFGMTINFITPVLYELRTLTTAFSFLLELRSLRLSFSSRR